MEGQEARDADPGNGPMWDTLATGVSTLPSDPFVDGLLAGGWITWGWKGDEFDYFDRITPRIVTSAVEHGKPILITFPDRCVHRSASLFSSLLMGQWHSAIKESRAGRQVLYLGQSVAIRRQLRDVLVKLTKHGSWNEVSRLFSQVAIDRTSRAETTVVQNDWEAFLPLVVYGYSDSDPESIIDARKPSLLVLDCTDEGTLGWVPRALEAASQANVSVVAWTSNPLSPAAELFRVRGRLHLQWPRITAHAKVPIREEVSGPILRDCFEFRELRGSTITPLVVGDPVSQALTGRILGVLHELSVVDFSKEPRLVRDAEAIVRRYLRALDGICVPMEFFEEECPNYWGLTAVSSLRAGLDHFLGAIGQSQGSAAIALGRAATDANLAHDILTREDPPLWRALVGEVAHRLKANASPVAYVFEGPARRQLFESALLRLKGIRREDLEKAGILLSDVSTGQPSARMPARAQSISAAGGAVSARLVFVNLSAFLRAASDPAWFTGSSISVLLLPHQTRFVERKAAELNWALSFRLDRVSDVVAELAPGWKPPSLPIHPRTTVVISPRTEARMIPRSRKIPELPLEQLTQDIDRLGEIAYLMGAAEDEPLGVVREDPRLTSGEPAEASETPWLDSVLEISFDEGWKARFDPEETVYVVAMDAGEPRPKLKAVSTLATGETVLFIRGQQRQSLYELLISRLHGMKELETHIQLVRRWPTEFLEAYQVKKREEGATLEMLLEACL